VSKLNTLYLDTNVIIARYKPWDPLYEVSNKLLSNESFEFFISPVTLFELYAVISRLRPNLVLPQEAKYASVNTIVRFVVEDCNLKLISKTYLVTTYFMDQRVRIPFEYSMSTILAEKLRLRALDLLHIAYASMLKDKVQIFVTGDDEILEKRDVIKKFTEFEIKHPKDLCQKHDRYEI